jgi:hypothetical protein
MASSIVRQGIVKALYKVDPASALLHMPQALTDHATKRWGNQSHVTKALVNPMLAGTVNSTSQESGALVPETLVRDEFIQAVFSASILGRLQGIIEVPALTRVNVEGDPVIAPFVGEYGLAPAFQGNFGVVMTDKRKVSIATVVTEDLLRMSNSAAENFISGILQRALSRGLDAGFVGAQARDSITPVGLAAVSVQASSFEEGVLAFTGDLSKASVIVNPRTAISLRSPSEQGITAAGGVYGGLPVITSLAVPLGKLFIVDASRVVAYLGTATVEMSREASVILDNGSGVATSTGAVYLFQENKRALLGTQYVDWDFAPGAAVEVTLPA